MNNTALKQELRARIFLHKRAIVGGALMQEYITRETQGAITLPPFVIREQASLYSDNIIQQAFQDGTFNTLYEDIWEKVKDIIPEHLKVL